MYSLGIAWNWTYDEDFISGIHQKCIDAGINDYLVNPQNLEETIGKLTSGKIEFALFFDRASEELEEFIPMVDFLHDSGTVLLNEPHLISDTLNKKIMHTKLYHSGVIVPHTLMIPPYKDFPDFNVSSTERKRLGKVFIAKPSENSGGGQGVHYITNSGTERGIKKTLRQISEARQEYPDDNYLLQRIVEPKMFDEHKGWFRIFYAFGAVIPCWWDPDTHIYDPLTREQTRHYKLQHLNPIMQAIQASSKLDFFSTEVAVDSQGRFYVIDYVNEVPDMRLKSKHLDGVPDIVVEKVEDRLVKYVTDFIKPKRGN
jgi:hypothetical protein